MKKQLLQEEELIIRRLLETDQINKSVSILLFARIEEIRINYSSLISEINDLSQKNF